MKVRRRRDKVKSSKMKFLIGMIMIMKRCILIMHDVHAELCREVNQAKILFT